MAELQEILGQRAEPNLDPSGATEAGRAGGRPPNRQEHLLLVFEQSGIARQTVRATAGLSGTASERDSGGGRRPRQRCNSCSRSARTRCAAISTSWPADSGRQYVPGRSWQGLAEALLAVMPPLVIADLGRGRGHVFATAGATGKTA